jgi:hypothetical protein
VRRGVALVDGRRSFLVQDEIEAPAPVAYRWLMHTRAEVKTDGSTATLTQDGKTVRARVLEPAGATLVAASAAAPPPQNPNDGITRLEVRLPDKVTAARVAVLLTPQKDGQTAAEPVQVTRLDEWVREAGPLPAEAGAMRKRYQSFRRESAKGANTRKGRKGSPRRHRDTEDHGADGRTNRVFSALSVSP